MIPPQSYSITNGPLRVHVDDQSFQSAARKCRRKIYRSRRLANATFLADDCEDIAHLLGHLGIVPRSHWLRLDLIDVHLVRLARNAVGSYLLECLSRMANPAVRLCTRRRR